MKTQEINNENLKKNDSNSKMNEISFKNRRKIEKNYTNEMFPETVESDSEDQLDQLSSQVMSLFSVLKSFDLSRKSHFYGSLNSALHNWQEYSQLLLKMVYTCFQINQKTNTTTIFPLFLIKHSFARFIDLGKFACEESLLEVEGGPRSPEKRLHLISLEQTSEQILRISNELFKKAKWSSDDLKSINQLISLTKMNNFGNPGSSLYLIYVGYELLVHFTKHNLTLSKVFKKNSFQTECLDSLKWSFVELFKWLNLIREPVLGISCKQTKSYFKFLFKKLRLLCETEIKKLNFVSSTSDLFKSTILLNKKSFQKNFKDLETNKKIFQIGHEFTSNHPSSFKQSKTVLIENLKPFIGYVISSLLGICEERESRFDLVLKREKEENVTFLIGQTNDALNIFLELLDLVSRFQYWLKMGQQVPENLKLGDKLSSLFLLINKKVRICFQKIHKANESTDLMANVMNDDRLESLLNILVHDYLKAIE